MADDQKDRFIQYLTEQHQEDELTKRAMELVLEDFMAEMKELKNQMASMQSKQSDLENQLSEERKLRQSAERKAKFLREKLNFANQKRFGDRRQRINSKAKKSDSDRQKEKDGYDGTDDTLRMDSVVKNKPQEVKELSGKRGDLSNLPDKYKTMEYVFIGNELKSAQFKDTVHQVCMFHAKIFVYLDDGELPIDNNLAEKTIRKLTTQRTVITALWQ